MKELESFNYTDEELDALLRRAKDQIEDKDYRLLEAMVESLKAGRIVDVDERPSLADALVGGIEFDNRYTFNLIQEFVDETVLVSEHEIAAAMTFALGKHHLVVEGGGAVGIAALLYGKVQHLGENIVVVVSGGNVDLSILTQVVQGKYEFQQE